MSPVAACSRITDCTIMCGSGFPRLGEFDVGACDGSAEPEKAIEKRDQFALPVGVGFCEDVLQV
jgi:hypothetical protein